MTTEEQEIAEVVKAFQNKKLSEKELKKRMVAIRLKYMRQRPQLQTKQPKQEPQEDNVESEDDVEEEEDDVGTFDILF